jgi:hypothetical protein
VLAVPHRDYLREPRRELLERVREGGAVVDVKSVLSPEDILPGQRYWSL